MNKKFIAMSLLGVTVSGFICPISSFATSLKEHFKQFEVNKNKEDVLKLIENSQYSDVQKDKLRKSVEGISNLEAIKSKDKKIEVLQSIIDEVFYKMSKEDSLKYVEDDCTSYTMNLIIHSVLSFYNDNYLELQEKPDLLFNIFENLIKNEENNKFNKAYIKGIYDTVKEYPYLSVTDLKKWNSLKEVSDKFYDSLEKNKTEDKSTVKGFLINLDDTKYIDESDFYDSTKKQLLKVHESFKISAININKNNVKNTIDEFLKIRVEKNNWFALSINDTIDKQYNSIIFLVNKLDKKDKIELIKYFDNKMVNLYASKDRDTTMCFKSSIDDLNNRYKSDVDLMNTIVDNGLKIFAYDNKHENEDEKGAVKVVGTHEDGRKDNGYLPGWKPWKPNPVQNLPLPKIYITNIEYKRINGCCYKLIITKDINNHIVKIEKFKTKGLYCGLIDDTQKSSLFSGVATSMGASDWYNISKDKKEESNESNKFYYYKLSDSLEFINTGVNVSKDMSLSYDKMKNLLYEIALKTNYKFMDDKDKFLIVVDGVPNVIKEEKKEYKIDDINNIFNKSNRVTVKLMTEQEAKELNLKYKLNIEKLKGVHIKNKIIEFKNKPIISNNSILVPIEDIAKELNINMSKENNNFIFKKDNSQVIVQENNNQIVCNGTSIALSSTPIIKEDKLFLEAKDFLKAFNYNISLNSDNEILEIN